MNPQLRAATFVLAGLCVGLASPTLEAWFDGGHMIVAYVAYQQLDSATRTRVDALIKLNPMYKTWTKNVASSKRGLTAFMRAATWPDCIKRASCAPGFTSDGPGGGDIPPGNASDDQNIGYADKLMHKYWHFIDTPFSAGAPGLPPKHPNALTEITLLAKAIGTSEPDPVKSYDIVWLEHLVGDVHQPLHATSRFTVVHPQGDSGGNLLFFCAKPCKDELHAFWDGLLGDMPTIAAASKTGKNLLAAPKPMGADDLKPDDWVTESFNLAKADVYHAPISLDNDPSTPLSPRPDAGYQTQADADARLRATLAGYRLAGLLNANLK